MPIVMKVRIEWMRAEAEYPRTFPEVEIQVTASSFDLKLPFHVRGERPSYY
jgi:hypothetical protein